MKRFLQTLTIIVAFALPLQTKAQFELFRDSVVQLYGIVMASSDLQPLSGTSVVIKGQNRGTVSNANGVFSIVVLKGDQVEFTNVGFKPVTINIPSNLQGNQHSVVQLMTTDTVFLPATIIKPRPSREQFERDFINTQVPDDQYAIAQKNNAAATRRFLAATLPQDGREASRQYMKQYNQALATRGQIAQQNILNPLAWAEFIRAWKRGDFKKKN
jgi:hypothetical protein